MTPGLAFRGGGRAARLGAAGLGAALVLAACSGSSPGTPAPAPDATGQLRQFRADRVRAVVEVTVSARIALQVTQVQLRVGGFAPIPPVPVDVAVPAGGLIDLPVPYGDVDCASAPGHADATLTLAGGSLHLDLPDDGLVGRLHTDVCDQRALDQAVELRVDPTWTETVVGATPTLTGTLRLVRRTPGQQVVLQDLGANILLSVRSDRTQLPLVVLGPDQAEASLPIIFAPARCDQHALTESKRTSLINVYAGLGTVEPRLTTITPDPASRERIEAFAVSGCRAITGS